MASYFPTGTYSTTAVTSGTVTVTGSSSSWAYGSVTLPASGSLLTANGAGTGYSWSTASPYVTVASGGTATPSITVSGNAEFDGEIKWKGKDLGKVLETIEKRLAILTPDPKKLEKFEALQKAYDHYKLLEALCQEDEDDK